MLCNLCKKEVETKSYEAHGIHLNFCEHCFAEVQKEIEYMEVFDRNNYIQTLHKFGVTPN